MLVVLMLSTPTDLWPTTASLVAYRNIQEKSLHLKFFASTCSLIEAWIELIECHLFNTLASGCFRGFSDKNSPECMWLCAGISLLLYRSRTWSKHQKTQQVF